MAISFQGLGNEGRLGNQMFQYAFVRGVAHNRGFDWVVPGPDADTVSYTHLTLPTSDLV